MRSEMLETARRRTDAVNARVNMVQGVCGASAEHFAKGPPISGQAAQLFCLTIEAMLQEPEP